MYSVSMALAITYSAGEFFHSARIDQISGHQDVAPAMQRQLYRAADQLERVQRQRGDENVPPPLNTRFRQGDGTEVRVLC
jgi:hypothetical protein